MTKPVSIEIDSVSVREALNKLVLRCQDMYPVMNSIGQRMEERVSARFESKTDPAGQHWAQWKPATVKSYPNDANGTLLDRYGDMLESLSYQANSSSATIGFGQPYSLYHELGTKHMTRRGMLSTDTGELGDKDEADILSLLNDYFSERI